MAGVAFGALARAQDEMEEKYAGDSDDDEAPSEDGVGASDNEEPERSAYGDRRRGGDDDDNGRAQYKKYEKVRRANKHAPAESSTRKRVSVVRDIPGLEPVRRAGAVGDADDVRFDTALGAADLSQARKNYAFLDEYRRDEVAALKEVLREAEAAERANQRAESGGGDDDRVTLPTLSEYKKRDLKRKIQSLEGQLRTMKARDFETGVVARYKHEVKSGAREGPLHLKRSDKRKLVLAEKYKVMKRKDVDKAVERKRKRNTARERKLMPSERRG